MEILKGQVWGQARVRDKPQGTPDKGESGGRKRREAEKWGGNLVGKSPDRRGRETQGEPVVGARSLGLLRANGCWVREGGGKGKG